MISLPNHRPGRNILLRGARQIVTLRGEDRPRRGAEMSQLGIIQDGAVLVSGHRILHVNSTRRVERLAEARDADEIDVSGKVVIPAFADCVTRLLHPVGSPDGNEVIARTSAALRLPTAQRLETEARRWLQRFAAQGTLRIATSPGWDDDERASWKALKVFDALRNGPVSLHAALALHSADSLELLERATRQRMISAAAVDARRESAQELALAAKRAGAGLRVHGDPCLSAATGATMFAGPVEWTPERISAARSAAAVWVTLPVVDWLRGHQPAPVRERIDDGLAVALSTGFGLEASATTSMAAVMSLACVGMRLSPAEALAATTINAACALGVAKDAGSLSPNKRADLLVLDCPDYRDLTMQLGTNLVVAAMRGGEWLSPARQLLRAS